MSQNPVYKYQSNIDYLGDFPGADVESNVLETNLASSEAQVDIGNRMSRELGVIGIRDAAGDRKNPATEETLAALAAALASNANDTLRTKVQAWNAGTLTTTDDGSFNVNDYSGSTIPTEQQTPVGIEDSGGTQVDPATSGDLSKKQEADEAYENGTSVASGGSTTKTLDAAGSDTLRGRVVRATTSYDVEVDWLDDQGNVIFTDSIASGVAAGTETSLNEKAISAHATVRVTDAGSGSGAVDAVYHLR